MSSAALNSSAFGHSVRWSCIQQVPCHPVWSTDASRMQLFHPCRPALSMIFLSSLFHCTIIFRDVKVFAPIRLCELFPAETMTFGVSWPVIKALLSCLTGTGSVSLSPHRANHFTLWVLWFYSFFPIPQAFVWPLEECKACAVLDAGWSGTTWKSFLLLLYVGLHAFSCTVRPCFQLGANPCQISECLSSLRVCWTYWHFLCDRAPSVHM